MLPVKWNMSVKQATALCGLRAQVIGGNLLGTNPKQGSRNLLQKVSELLQPRAAWEFTERQKQRAF